MNLKQSIVLCCILGFFVSSAASVYAQREKKPVKNATWQTSVDDSRQGSVTLGIRDKWAALKRFTASFVVTAPGNKKFRAKTTTTADEFAYVHFPDDFDGNPSARGTFAVVFYANGVIIGRDKFRFRP